MVLVAWFNNEVQLALARAEEGFFYVRLGRRNGALHVHPNLARTRHVLLRTHGSCVAPGLLLLREPGFRIFTRTQLRSELSTHAKGAGVSAWQASAARDDDEHIYALFRTGSDETFTGMEWDADLVMNSIEDFESDIRQKPVENVGRTVSVNRHVALPGLKFPVLFHPSQD